MSIRSLVRGCVVVLALVLAGACEAADASVKTVLSDPARYDNQPVSLAGTVNQLDARISRKGNDYYTFTLDDGSGRITVFSFGHPPCTSPDRVAVDGTFRRVKQVGRHTFHNQVDARRVTCR